MVDKLNSEEYPSNSLSKKSERRVVRRVTKGRVGARKKPLISRIFGGDLGKAIGTFVLSEVLIPAAKSTLSDVVDNVKEMMLYGEPQRRGGRRDRGDRSYVSYSSYYRERESRRGEPISSRKRVTHNFDDVLFNRDDAREVLSSMVDFIEDYGLCTVGDFYDLAGLPKDWNDDTWGWEDLSSAYVKRVRDGFIIDLPRPRPIDD